MRLFLGILFFILLSIWVIFVISMGITVALITFKKDLLENLEEEDDRPE